MENSSAEPAVFVAPEQDVEAWSLTRIGYCVRASACLIALMLLTGFRSRPSNGVCLTYAQYFIIHLVIMGMFLVIDFVELRIDYEENLRWWADMLEILAAGVFIRLFGLLVYKEKNSTLSKFSYVGTVLAWGIVTSMGQIESNIPLMAVYLKAGFVLFGSVLLLCVIGREWCRAVFGLKTYDVQKGNAESCFAGWSRKIFTSVGLFGFSFCIIDYIFLITAEFDAKLAVWECEFLSRILDSAIYIPFIVVFSIWADCPDNVKMVVDEEFYDSPTKTIEADTTDFETTEAYTTEDESVSPMVRRNEGFDSA